MKVIVLSIFVIAGIAIRSIIWWLNYNDYETRADRNNAIYGNNHTAESIEKAFDNNTFFNL